MSSVSIENPDENESTTVDFSAQPFNISSVLTNYKSKIVSARSFKKRVCIYAVPDKKDPEICAGCKQALVNGIHIADGKRVTKWTPEACTELSVTDAYGKIKFGTYEKRANYIRVEHNTSPKELVRFLYSETGWNLNMPQLIISVTGGAQNFTIPYRMKKAFKQGLIKAATSTNAWIITGGTNTGVMKLVGEAVSEAIADLTKLAVIGVATWGKVAYRDTLLREENDSDNVEDLMEWSVPYENQGKGKSDGVELDPNHTHFVFVDDGSIGTYGVEINLRAELESELTLGRPLKYYTDNILGKDESIERIPMILIVVQGGPRTLQTVFESADKGVPVIIIQGSKGCADLVANACKLENPSDEELFQLTIESNLTKANETSKIKEAVEYLKKILANHKDLINVFELDGEDIDIESTILRVFLNANKSSLYETLKLAVKWDQIEFARTEIFNGDEKFEQNQLQNLMELAILENKPAFVELLLENYLNLAQFLTVRRLIFLYNSEKIKSETRKLPLYQFKKSAHNRDNSQPFYFGTLNNFCNARMLADIEFKFIPSDTVLRDGDEGEQTKTYFRLNDFLNHANTVGSTYAEDENTNDYGTRLIDFAPQNLFLWSIVHNRMDLAKIFWRIGQNQICNALFASALLKSMAVGIHDLKNDLLGYAEEFEELAISILTLYDERTDDLKNMNLLMSEIPYYHLSTIEMAQIADCKKFVSQSCVQNLLTKIWNGETDDSFTSNLRFFLDCATCGVFRLIDPNGFCRKLFCVKCKSKSTFPELVYRREEIKYEDEIPKKNNWEEFKRFLEKPRARFHYYFWHFLVFLAFFSYMMLFEFDYREKVKIFHPFVSLLNETNSTIKGYYEEAFAVKKPSWILYLLTFWIFTFFCEEARQFYTAARKEAPFFQNIKTYFEDYWNYLDLFGCIIFLIALLLLIASLIAENQLLFVYARILFSVDLFIWYMRILHFSLIFPILGPKIVMIQNMMKDLIFFIIIIAVFVCAFGVVTQANLYPSSENNPGLISNIITFAYWPMHGDMRILDDHLLVNRCANQTDVQYCENDKPSVTFSYIAFMIYMVFANVLLMNLLIAMFSATFAHVEENTDQIWKFQRHSLIFDFKNLPLLPPPFILFVHIYKLFKMIKKKHIGEDEEVKTKYKQHEKSFMVHNLEKIYTEMYLKIKKAKDLEIIDERLKSTQDKIENVEQRLNEVTKIVKDLSQLIGKGKLD